MHKKLGLSAVTLDKISSIKRNLALGCLVFDGFKRDSLLLLPLLIARYWSIIYRPREQIIKWDPKSPFYYTISHNLQRRTLRKNRTSGFRPEVTLELPPSSPTHHWMEDHEAYRVGITCLTTQIHGCQSSCMRILCFLCGEGQHKKSSFDNRKTYFDLFF